MKKPRWWLVGLSATIALVSAVVKFAAGYAAAGSSVGEKLLANRAYVLTHLDSLDIQRAHEGVRGWLAERSAGVSLVLFLLIVLSVVIDFFRTLFDSRHAAKPAVERLIDEFSKTHFQDRERHNRVTLFKKSSGWRTKGWSRRWYRRSKLNRAFDRTISTDSEYLGVYVRARGARHPSCDVAWKVSELNGACEGVAGLIYDEAGWIDIIVKEVPADRTKLANVRGIEELPAGEALRDYAECTNIRTIESYRVLGSLAKHYCGVPIQVAGKTWGVLIVDSTEDVFHFLGDGVSGKKALAELAFTLSKIVSP